MGDHFFFFVFFDLETTSIDHSTQHDGVQICSIAASTSNGSTVHQFNYVFPYTNQQFSNWSYKT